MSAALLALLIAVHGASSAAVAVVEPPVIGTALLCEGTPSGESVCWEVAQ